MKTTVQTLISGPNGLRGNGQTVDRVDQLSSVVLLGLAVTGAVVALGLLELIHGRPATHRSSPRRPRRLPKCRPSTIGPVRFAPTVSV